MNKSYNRLLIGGIIVIILGIALFCYSIKSYAQIRYLENHIDFDELDNNNRISTSDKYYKYLSIQDFLNQNLNKNKNLPLKNSSCIYLDYAQHNLLSLHKLIFKMANEDNSRKSVVEGNIRTYLILLDDYKTCRKYSQYKSEFNDILDKMSKIDDLEKENRMNKFLNSERVIPKAEDNYIEEELDIQNSNEESQIEVNQENKLTTPPDEKSDNIIKPYLE